MDAIKQEMEAEAHSLTINHLDDSMREIFSCKICHFRTIYFYRLRAHFWTHETKENLAETISAFEDSHTALYKTYLLPPSTLEAMDNSLSENVLSKSSTRSSELNCSHCSYQASEKIILKDHILSHIEEKPFYGKLKPVIIIRPSHLEKYLSTNKKPAESAVIKGETFSDVKFEEKTYSSVIENLTDKATNDTLTATASCNLVFNQLKDDPMTCEISGNIKCDDVTNKTISGRSTEEKNHDAINIIASERSNMETTPDVITITAIEKCTMEKNHGVINITTSERSTDEKNVCPINIASRESSTVEMNPSVINITASEMSTDETNHSLIKITPSEKSTLEKNHGVINITASEKSTVEAAADPVVIFAVHEGLTRLPRTKEQLISDKVKKSLLRSKSGNTSSVEYHCCQICPYKSRKEVHLKQHSIIHSDVKPFACKICPFKTKYLSSLKNHSVAHSGTQRYSCDQCLFKTTQMYNLKEHMLIHTGGKKHLCDICSYQSIRQSTFKRHMLKHTGEKPHTCHICSFKTSAKCRLNSHLKNVHKTVNK